MLSWIGVIISIILGVWVVKSTWSDSCDKILGIAGGLAIAALIIISLCCSYYTYRIQAPEEYNTLKIVLQDITNLYNKDSNFDLKDVEINKEVATSIRNLREFEKEMRVAKKSIFTLFKPTFELGS